MDKKTEDLIDTILIWWKEHECDCHSSGGEDYNVYNGEPDFVKKAKEIKEEIKCKRLNNF